MLCQYLEWVDCGLLREGLQYWAELLNFLEDYCCLKICRCINLLPVSYQIHFKISLNSVKSLIDHLIGFQKSKGTHLNTD